MQGVIKEFVHNLGVATQKNRKNQSQLEICCSLRFFRYFSAFFVFFGFFKMKISKNSVKTK